MRKIGFIGYDSIDIVLYTARLLKAATDSKVVVVDKTLMQSVIGTVDLPSDCEGTGFYHENIIISDSYVTSEADDSTIVLYYFEYNFNCSELAECEDVFLVTDLISTNARNLNMVDIKDKPENPGVDIESDESDSNSKKSKKKGFGKSKKYADDFVEGEVRVHLIIRNVIDLKYGEKYISTLINKNIREDRVHYLPMSELEYKNRCYVCMDYTKSLAHLTDDMKTVLISILSQLTEKEYLRKDALLLINNA